MVAAPTLVVFRRHKLTHQVLALLPRERPGYGLCQALTSGGPVATVDYGQVLRDTVPASALLQADVRALMLELVSGPNRYQVQVVTAEQVPVERNGPGQQLGFFAAGNQAPQYAR